MKRLTCEMCGSTDLMKQDGVFVCQTCGCKYSVEEARKMMVEGTVDVSGSTVKVDSTERLQNLYTLARRARDENNASDARRYYDEIRIEDPNSWEAAFYAVYFAALDIRIAQITSAAYSVANCIDSVMELISVYVAKEEQEKAYTEVAGRIIMLSNILLGAAEKTYYDTYRGNMTSAFNDFREREDAILTAVRTVITQISQRFDDVYTAYSLSKMIIETIIKIHGNSEKAAQQYNPFIFDLSDQLKKKMENIQQQKNEEYWETHIDERNTLEAEKKTLEDQIASIESAASQKVYTLQKQMKEIPALEEAAAINSRIKKLVSYKNSLGLFKNKEKESVQTRIERAKEESAVVQKEIESAEGEIKRMIEDVEAKAQSAVAPLQQRLNEINEELTKNR